MHVHDVDKFMPDKPTRQGRAAGRHLPDVADGVVATKHAVLRGAGLEEIYRGAKAERTHSVGIVTGNFERVLPLDFQPEGRRRHHGQHESLEVGAAEQLSVRRELDVLRERFVDCSYAFVFRLRLEDGLDVRDRPVVDRGQHFGDVVSGAL